MVDSVNFVPGFNFWYVLAPLMAAAMGYFGCLKYSLNYRTLKIERVFSETAMKVVAAVLGFCFELMLKFESERGLVQLCANRFGDEAVIAMPFYALGMLAVVVLYTLVLYYIQVITGNLKAIMLHKERNGLLAERDQRKSPQKRGEIIRFPGVEADDENIFRLFQEAEKWRSDEDEFAKKFVKWEPQAPSAETMTVPEEMSMEEFKRFFQENYPGALAIGE